MTREQQMQDMMTAAFWRDIEEGNQPDNGDAIEIAKTYERAYQQGWRDADQHPHWIPVEERLPEETEVVLGVREGGTDVEMYRFMGFNESTNTFDWEWHPYYRAVVDGVTHWMPIVPPRKEE